VSLRAWTPLLCFSLGLCSLAWGLRSPLAHAQDAEEAEVQQPAAPPLWERPNQCERCHVETDWWLIHDPDDDTFDHTETGFPLNGAHATVDCEGCHRSGLQSLSGSCQACHQDPHAGFNTVSCEECHNERHWEVPRNFAFHERTRFPLTGAHASIECEACHRQRRGEPAPTIPTECTSCHAQQLRAAQPDHLAAGFIVCGNCHSTLTFKGATYVHNSYVLAGRHAQVSCAQCHTGNVFAGLAQSGDRCLDCHQDDFALANALSANDPAGIPDHTNFNPTCGQAGCHTQAAIDFIEWDIDGMTGR